MQSLDKEREFGTIYGHHSAMFEQDGRLFGGDGKPAAAPEEDEPASEEETVAGTWLRTQLAGGPVAQTELYKQCQIDSLNWDEVRNAANSMQVKKYKYRQVDTWKLTE